MRVWASNEHTGEVGPSDMDMRQSAVAADAWHEGNGSHQPMTPTIEIKHKQQRESQTQCSIEKHTMEESEARGASSMGEVDSPCAFRCIAVSQMSVRVGRGDFAFI